MRCDFETSAEDHHRCRRCGFLVRSRHAAAKIVRECPVARPSSRQKAWDLARSAASFVADGLRTVRPEQYVQRLEICDACEARRDNRCSLCGCRLSLKARGRAFDCPLKKWPAA